MTELCFNSAVVTILKQWSQTGEQHAQVVKRTRHLFDLLVAVGTQVDCPQVKYLQTKHDLLTLVRPIPHAVFYFARYNGDYVGLSFSTHEHQINDDQAVATALEQLQKLRMENLPLFDWPPLRDFFGATPSDEALLIDTLTTLQAARFKRNISIVEMAWRMALTEAQLAKVERVDAVPSIATLQRYAVALDLSLDLTVDGQTR